MFLKVKSCCELEKNIESTKIDKEYDNDTLIGKSRETIFLSIVTNSEQIVCVTAYHFRYSRFENKGISNGSDIIQFTGILCVLHFKFFSDEL